MSGSSSLSYDASYDDDLDRPWESPGSASSTPGRSTSLRKRLSQKFSLPSLRADKADKAADRTDGSSRRGDGESREPPAIDRANERDISSFNDKGNEFFANGEFDAALRMYGEALKLLKSTTVVMQTEGGEEFMPLAMRRVRTARCLVNVGAVHIRREHYEDATTSLEVAMRHSSQVASNGKHYHKACEVTADALENLGLVLFKQKNYEKSSVMYSDALDARRKCLDLMKARHKRRFHLKSKEEVRKYRDERNASQLELSVTLFYMSLLKERQGAIEEAVEYCEESLAIRREVIPDAKQDPNALNLSTTIGRLYIHDRVQRYKDALGYLHEVHRMKCESSGPEHFDVVPSLNSIAFVHNATGQYEKCIVLSERAIDIATHGRGINKETAAAKVNKGDAHRNLHDYALAIASYEEALDIQAKCLEPTDMTNAEVNEKLAETCFESLDYPKAIAALEKCVDIKHAALGPDSLDLARSHSKLGEYYAKAGNPTHGIKSRTRALRIFKHLDRKEMAAKEHNKIAGMWKDAGEPEKAMEHYMASLWNSREARLPSTDPIVADTIKNVASFQNAAVEADKGD